MATNPHIYVSSVYGTNTGTSDESYASQQTGAMSSISGGASSVYDNIGSAIAGAAPTGGETYYIADDHDASHDNAGDIFLSNNCRIISVSASNIDQYSPGAKENLTDTSDVLNLNSAGTEVLIAGLDFEAGAANIEITQAGCTLRCIDCTFRPDGAGDICVYTTNDGARIEFVNVDVIGNASSSDCMRLGGSAFFTWYGGSVTTSNNLFIPTGTAAFTAEIYGVDLSPIVTIFDALALGDENPYVKLFNCKLNSNLNFGTPVYAGQRVELWNSDDTTGGKFYRFKINDYSGTVSNNDSTHVTTTESWYEGSDKSSIEVTTTANCNHVTPLVFEIPAQYVDLSQTASDVLTLDLVTDSTQLSLTDTDIAAFLVYPDGTTAVQANWVTSGKTDDLGTGNYGIDPLAPGTELLTSSLGAGDWTGEPASANFYKLELDTSGIAGQATVCSVRIEVYKSEILSGELFIHPLLTLS